MAKTNKTKRERHFDQLLHEKCSKYLHDNFHKFNESNKLRVSLSLVNKFGISTQKLDIDQNIISNEDAKNYLEISNGLSRFVNN